MSRWDITGTIIMGIAQIIREEDRVTVITDQGNSVTRSQSSTWSDSTNNEEFDKAIEEALSKDE